MSISFLNSFCRRFDLVYVEQGTKNGCPVYWFLDFKHERRYYTKEEIYSKMGI